MKKYNFNLNNLFQNNKFLMLLSFLLSFTLWCIISIYSAQFDGNLETKLISDIQIAINLSDSAKENNYHAFFNGDSLKAQISIVANRLILGQISKNDIQVVANQPSDTINYPGYYDFELAAKRNSNIKDYKIESIAPNFIKVMIDRFKVEEFEIEDRIKFKSDPKFTVGRTSFSNSKISISGPESKIKEIDKVCAVGEFNDILKKSTTLSSKIVLYNKNDEVVDPELLTLSFYETEATIPILLSKSLPISLNFKNQPEGFEATSERVKITPSTIEIAGPEDIINDITEIKLNSLDFNKIDPSHNNFELPIDLPKGCRNLNNVALANITMDLSGYICRTMSVTKFNFSNLSEDKQASVGTASISVTIVGPESAVNEFKQEDLVAQIDLKDKSYTGYKEIPVQVNPTAKTGCWVFGEYSANVSIKQKS
ncbi:MAG: hypothetical protein LBJ95_04225 [Oscillospiraceae bacterium]|jgi:YbbR domain-containing protein|nr:hypothetical protein [Oscillospiraceae bacterium]